LAALLIAAIAVAFGGCGDKPSGTPTSQEPAAKSAEPKEAASEAKPAEEKKEEAASDAKPADEEKKEAKSADDEDEGFDTGDDDDFDAFDYSAGGGSRSGKTK
jgi:hypothetical protein